MACDRFEVDPETFTIRRSYKGAFANMRAAEEARRGRTMFHGRYRSRVEIVETILAAPCWKGAQVIRTNSGWSLIKGTAHMFIRAETLSHDFMIAQCEFEERDTAEAA